jgi:hypothetical protein
VTVTRVASAASRDAAIRESSRRLSSSITPGSEPTPEGHVRRICADVTVRDVFPLGRYGTRHEFQRKCGQGPCAGKDVVGSWGGQLT